MASHDTTDPPPSGQSSGLKAGGYSQGSGPGGTDPLGSAGSAESAGAQAGMDEVRSKSERPSMRPGGASSLLGTTISGRYRIERLLGEGGMGAVYQAEHTHMRKRLAVKVLHPEMSRLPEVVARFEREAMAAAHIDHPNVATATDFGKLDDGSFFLVLEYVEGKSLRESIALGPLETARAMRILRQTAAALQRARARHRPPRSQARERDAHRARRRSRLREGARLRSPRSPSASSRATRRTNRVPAGRRSPSSAWSTGRPSTWRRSKRSGRA